MKLFSLRKYAYFVLDIEAKRAPSVKFRKEMGKDYLSYLIGTIDENPLKKNVFKEDLKVNKIVE